MIERVPVATPRTFAEEAVMPAAPRASAHDFTAVYADWFRTVYRWLHALGGPEADVEDLTQEVFVVVQRRLTSFDGRHLSAWLYQIAARTLSDHRRRRWFRDLFLRVREVDPDDTESSCPDPEQRLAQKQEEHRFYRLVARMNPRWRDSFVLFEIEGYRGEEIALLTGQPVATVRTHLHRARNQFLLLVAKETR